jgi:hypothetical protein
MSGMRGREIEVCPIHRLGADCPLNTGDGGRKLMVLELEVD